MEIIYKRSGLFL